MTRGDGNCQVISAGGQHLWGRYGAAGLLLGAPAPDSSLTVLLQRRAWWSHHGGTWGIPGGAIDSHENAHVAAIREAVEETHLPTIAMHPRTLTEITADVALRNGGRWTYTTVIATAASQPPTFPGAESDDLAWVPVANVAGLSLHPDFAASWPLLRTRLHDLMHINAP